MLELWLTSQPIQPRGFYVWTDNIFDDKSWSDPIYFDLLGIDQDVSTIAFLWGRLTADRQLFFDDDDRVYLSVSRFSTGTRQASGSKLITYASEIDLRTGDSIGPTTPLRVSTVSAGVAEGPHIYKQGGWYYLVTADGGTGPNHQVWIMRSRQPLGPFEEPPKGVNPLVHNGPDPLVQRTGHADLVRGSDGRWWMVMLGVRQQGTALSQLGRETFLAPVEWQEGGWPTVNSGRKIELVIGADLPEKLLRPDWRDNFTSGKPLQSDRSVEERLDICRRARAWMVYASDTHQAHTQLQTTQRPPDVTKQRYQV